MYASVFGINDRNEICLIGVEEPVKNKIEETSDKIALIPNMCCATHTHTCKPMQNTVNGQFNNPSQMIIASFYFVRST